jgi:signal transduction histidine kinase
VRRGLLPALLFVVAAAGVAVLGSRVAASERVAAYRSTRDLLRTRAREAEAVLALQAKGRASLGFDVSYSLGLFSWEPLPFEHLEPHLDDDTEAAFYLAEGERAEAADGDPTRAEGLYRSAAAEGRGLHSRLVAHFRLAAIARRRGDDAGARAAETAFLALLPDSRKRAQEALIVRARAPRPDSGLSHDLLLAVGTPEEPVAIGILREFGIATEDAIRGRREELARHARLRPVAEQILAAPRGGPERRWGVLGERVVAWEDRFPSVHFLEEPLPPLPDGVHLTPMGETSDREDEVEESLVAGDPPLRFRIVAVLPGAVVEASARRRAGVLGATLVVLLLAGGAASVLSVRAARREAEAARARAAFVTRVGHDLRTPLAVIRMYAETLAAGKVADPGEAREFAGIAAREAERLTGMVGQALDLERVAEGDGALAQRPLDLAALAAEVAESHRPLLENAGLRLEVRGDGPLLVTGDSSALRGAVANLLENACRHAASGGSVEIETGRNGTMAEVRVLDRGPGLPGGMEERLFERFVRGPDAQAPGAGLGLALVREAAEAHGGGAAASNREGGGAVFVLRLPAGEEGA